MDLAADSDAPGTTIANPRRPSVVWTAGVFAALLVIALLIARRSLRVDFFFDEMWRVDMIRASNTREQYLKHDTALAPGWLYLMRALTTFEDRRPILRLLALACFPAGLTVLWSLLARMLHTGARSLIVARWMSACAVLVAAVCQGLAATQAYFNNYGFEVLVGAGVAWSCYIISTARPTDRTDDRTARRRAITFLGCFLVASPFFVQSALLLWPIGAWHFALGLEAARHGGGEGIDASSDPTFRNLLDGFRDWRILAVLAAGGIVGVLTGLAFYRPVAGNGGTETFWQDVAIKDGPALGKLVGNVGEALRDSALWAASPSLIMIVVSIACAACAVRVIARAWPGYLRLIVCGQVAAIAFSALAGWPVAPVRVNLGFTVLAIALIPLGGVLVVEHIVTRLALQLSAARRSLMSHIAVGVVAAAALAVGWPAGIVGNSGGVYVFARGMTDDLLTVANDTSSEGLVLSYHPMSHWYTHDLLINHRWPAKTFRVIRETDSELLYGKLGTTLQRELGNASDVWCVIPYEIGPERALEACQVYDPRLVEISRVQMERIELVRFVRTDQ